MWCRTTYAAMTRAAKRLRSAPQADAGVLGEEAERQDCPAASAAVPAAPGNSLDKRGAVPGESASDIEQNEGDAPPESPSGSGSDEEDDGVGPSDVSRPVNSELAKKRLKRLQEAYSRRGACGVEVQRSRAAQDQLQLSSRVCWAAGILYLSRIPPHMARHHLHSFSLVSFLCNEYGAQEAG